jgi:hypothetical protein
LKVPSYIVEIEGIDKTGKDLVKAYITLLSDYKYIVQSRGLLSNMVYAEKYGRDYDYSLIYRPIIVYLDVDEEDRRVRCVLTNEPNIDADADKRLFNKYKTKLRKSGITIYEFNTTHQTPYQIATQVLELIEKGN